MSNFYARICRRGHVEIKPWRAAEGDLCSRCGQPLIDSCPECGSLIKQWRYYGMVYITPQNMKFERPDRCRSCGAEFPWSEEE